MFDEITRLQEKTALQTLLRHYAELGMDDRKTWQDRVMALEGIDDQAMTRWHGELLAHEWIEQNTGNTRAGAMLGCYRITDVGLKAFLYMEGGFPKEEDWTMIRVPADEKSLLDGVSNKPIAGKSRRKKKRKITAVEAVG